MWAKAEREGTVVRCEHFILKFFTPLTMRSLSPMLAMPISLRVSWSSSSKISPRISLFLKVLMCAAHLLSASHRATWASLQVHMKSEKGVPCGGSSMQLGLNIGVTGKEDDGVAKEREMGLEWAMSKVVAVMAAIIDGGAISRETRQK